LPRQILAQGRVRLSVGPAFDHPRSRRHADPHRAARAEVTAQWQPRRCGSAVV